MRSGVDVRAPNAGVAYKEMMLQVARDYPGLPDVRTLTVGEIVFFYSGLREELKRHTRPKPEPRAPTKPKRRRKHGR